MTSKVVRTSTSASEEELALLSPKNSAAVLATITVRNFAGQSVDTQIPLTATVSEFKSAIAAQLELADPDAFQIVYQGAVLETGTLADHALQHGSRVDITPRLRTGRGAPSEAAQMAQLQKFLSDLATAVPDNIASPVSVSFPIGGQTVTLTIEPASQPDADGTGDESAGAGAGAGAPVAGAPVPISPTADLRDRFQQLQSSLASSGGADEDERERELPAEEIERRRMLMQAMADQSRAEAAATRQRSADNKRTASKLEELQAKMRAKRAHRERACYATHTALPSGAPAQPPAPPKPAPAFAGLRRGFLPMPAQPAPGSNARPSASTPASAPAPADAGARPAATFGGMQRGFLFGKKARQ